jgi:hypothetical protein
VFPESTPLLQFLIAGELRRDFILPPCNESLNNKLSLDIPGGSLLYSAAGLSIWTVDAGLLARVGENYPQAWLDQISIKGFNTSGVNIIHDSIEPRRFFAYTSVDACHTENPVAHFARLGVGYPKSLLGYIPPSVPINSRSQASPETLRITDIPKSYLDCSAAHLCPMDYLSHHLLPPALQQGHITTITLDPSAGYMNPAFWDEVHLLTKGITAFLTSEEKLRSLFHGRSTNLWEMAEDIASGGCEIVVIKRGQNGQFLYDHAGKNHWQIPAYPTRVTDPTGAGDAFCGGFLAGYRTSYDPLTATLFGNISASFVIEGSGPYYIFDTLPGLPEARLESIRGLVSRV